MQLLTDEEFQKLRLKQTTAQLQPKSGHNRDSKLLVALEEGRCVKACVCHIANAIRWCVDRFIHIFCVFTNCKTVLCIYPYMLWNTINPLAFWGTVLLNWIYDNFSRAQIGSRSVRADA